MIKGVNMVIIESLFPSLATYTVSCSSIRLLITYTLYDVDRAVASTSFDSSARVTIIEDNKKNGLYIVNFGCV